MTLLMLWLTAVAEAAATASAATAPGMSMDQAVHTAEKRYHARVIKAQSQKDGTHTVYVLRLLDESGKVRTVRVDAVSGAIQ
jgi:uncharacterized membrane protein YkoI